MAHFIPAVSSAYENYIKDGHPEFDFMEQWPEVLYSAGHAGNNPNAWMLKSPNRKFVLGDSGGFQVGTGKWRADWAAYDKKAVALVDKTLEWLQNTDAHTTLDVPLWGVAKGTVPDIRTALEASKRNAEVFLQSERSVCNVFSAGRELAHNDAWFYAMKEFSNPDREQHFKGIAIASLRRIQLSTLLDYIKRLLDHNCLHAGTEHIHILGDGELAHNYVYQCLQEALRQILGVTIPMTFDSASPYVLCANAQFYKGFTTPSNGNWGFQSEFWRRINNKDQIMAEWLLEQGGRATPVTHRFTVGDMEDASKGYYCLFNHNTHIVCEGHRWVEQNWRTLNPTRITKQKIRSDCPFRNTQPSFANIIVQAMTEWLTGSGYDTNIILRMDSKKKYTIDDEIKEAVNLLRKEAESDELSV